METSNKPQEDIMAIRDMMERSSKFLSLSGLSGVFAGCIAIIGSAVAYFIILKAGSIKYDEYMQSLTETGTSEIRWKLIITALAILIIALCGALYFSIRKARKNKQYLWNKTSKELLMHLFIPLIAGGLFSIILIFHNNINLIASTTLIFYGLALVNAGKFTFGEIHYLGLCEIVLGILAGVILNYGLLFWVIGFGFLHITYGLAMYFKYDR